MIILFHLCETVWKKTSGRETKCKMKTHTVLITRPLDSDLTFFHTADQDCYSYVSGYLFCWKKLSPSKAWRTKREGMHLQWGNITPCPGTGGGATLHKHAKTYLLPASLHRHHWRKQCVCVIDSCQKMQVRFWCEIYQCSKKQKRQFILRWKYIWCASSPFRERTASASQGKSQECCTLSDPCAFGGGDLHLLDNVTNFAKLS